MDGIGAACAVFALAWLASLVLAAALRLMWHVLDRIQARQGSEAAPRVSASSATAPDPDPAT